MKKTSTKSKILKTILLTAALTSSFMMMSCNGKNKKSAGSEKRKITIAFNQGARPHSWVDENGKLTGYEYELFKAIEKELPQYEFNYYTTAQEDAFVSVDAGRSQIYSSALFKNPLREKKYLFPANPNCVTVTGFVVHKKFENNLQGFNKENGFSDIVDNKLRLAPVSTNTGWYGVVLEYNEKNPDKQLEFETSTNLFGSAELLNWILQGRYDAAIFNKHEYDQIAEVDKQVAENIIFVPTYGLGVYPIFNKNETQLKHDYDTAYEKLWKDGTVDALLKKWFVSSDIFNLLRDNEKLHFD